MGRFSLQYSALVKYVIPKGPQKFSFQHLATWRSAVCIFALQFISLWLIFVLCIKFVSSWLFLLSQCNTASLNYLRYFSYVAPYLTTPQSACSMAANLTAKAGQHTNPMLNLCNSKLKLVSKTTLLYCKLPISTAVLLTASMPLVQPCNWSMRFSLLILLWLSFFRKRVLSVNQQICPK